MVTKQLHRTDSVHQLLRNAVHDKNVTRTAALLKAIGLNAGCPSSDLADFLHEVADSITEGARGSGSPGRQTADPGPEAGQRQLSIHVCTWNLGNAQPSDDISSWLPEGGGGHDIIAIGVQESKYVPNQPTVVPPDPSPTAARRRVAASAAPLAAVAAGISWQHRAVQVPACLTVC
jgi:hypothetical protein